MAFRPHTPSFLAAVSVAGCYLMHRPAVDADDGADGGGTQASCDDRDGDGACDADDCFPDDGTRDCDDCAELPIGVPRGECEDPQGRYAVAGRSCSGSAPVRGTCEPGPAVCFYPCRELFDYCEDEHLAAYLEEAGASTILLDCREHCGGVCAQAVGACSCP
ncbi:MAG: hypothetical protein HYY06_22525 [Deltaproteobacteria bacterium]|nr:hypothetical protein [Deltaproteobacteria bacterium]